MGRKRTICIILAAIMSGVLVFVFLSKQEYSKYGEAGLYQNGTRVMTWEQILTDVGYGFFDGETINKTKGDKKQKSYFTNLQGKLIIPEGITKIERSAFEGCKKLTEIILPQSLVTIEYYAFAETKIKHIDIPQKVNEIGCAAFYLSAIETINLPENLTTISDSAFKDSKLCKIELPDAVETIGEFAFSGTEISHIYISENVSEIGVGAFSYCNFLTSINVSKNNEKYLCCTDYYGNNDAILFESLPFETTGTTFSKKLICYAAGKKDTKYETPLTLIDQTPYSVYSKDFYVIHEIGDYAFAGCKNLTEVTIDGFVFYIGKYAFANCENIKKITLCESLFGIREGAFYATGIEEIVLPELIYSINKETFNFCDKLTKVTIPECCKIIEKNAFSNIKTICGKAGSYAETYAKENNIEFIAQ